MRKPVNDSVSKVWASSVKILLTGCSPDITTLFDRLLTLENREKQLLKTQVARQRLRDATQALVDSIKYGWQFGISNEEPKLAKRVKFEGSRRVSALIPVAIEAGTLIGACQLKKINGAHGIPKPGSVSHRHTHLPAVLSS